MIFAFLQQYFWSLVFVLLIFGHLWLNCTGSRERKDAEFRLQTDLLINHSTTILPSINESTPVNVKLGLALRQILDVDEKNQVIVTSIWFRQYWQDHILQWDASQYQGVNELHMTRNDIWVPDITLYNTASDHGILYKRLDTQVIINNKGSASWLTPIQLKSECKIDVKYFPFDEQTCKLTFGSWTYHGGKVDLFPAVPTADLSSLVTNTEWEVIEAPFTKAVKYYGCCPDPYPSLTVHLRIRRRALFYLSNLIIPCAVIAFLASLSFFLPSHNGERISLVVTVLLSLTVYMLIVSETMPPTSDVVPLIGKFYICTMVLIALTLVAVIITLNCCEREYRMPKWLRQIIFVYLARVVCVSDLPKATGQSQAFIVSNNKVEPKATKDVPSGVVTKDDDQIPTYVLESINNPARLRHREEITSQSKSNEIEAAKAEWKSASRILDRTFFLLFLIYFFLMTTIVFSAAPNISLS